MMYTVREVALFGLIILDNRMLCMWMACSAFEKHLMYVSMRREQMPSGSMPSRSHKFPAGLSTLSTEYLRTLKSNTDKCSAICHKKTSARYQ